MNELKQPEHVQTGAAGVGGGVGGICPSGRAIPITSGPMQMGGISGGVQQQQQKQTETTGIGSTPKKSASDKSIGQKAASGKQSSIEVESEEPSHSQQQKQQQQSTNIPGPPSLDAETRQISGLLREGTGEPNESHPATLVTQRVVSEHIMAHDEPGVTKGVDRKETTTHTHARIYIRWHHSSDVSCGSRRGVVTHVPVFPCPLALLLPSSFQGRLHGLAFASVKWKWGEVKRMLRKTTIREMRLTVESRPARVTLILMVTRSDSPIVTRRPEPHTSSRIRAQLFAINSSILELMLIQMQPDSDSEHWASIATSALPPSPYNHLAIRAIATRALVGDDSRITRLKLHVLSIRSRSHVTHAYGVFPNST